MKVVCINLKRRKDRLIKFQDICDRESLEFERVEAVEGWEVPGMLSGNVGCVESHRKILKSVIYSNENYLVFEDDTELIRSFTQELNSAIRELPAKWDILYLGGNNVSRPTRVSPRLCRCVRTYTTNAYLINPQAAKRLIEMIPEIPNEPIDISFCKLQTEGNCYVANPPLSWQRADWSDIQNMHMDVESRMKEIY